MVTKLLLNLLAGYASIASPTMQDSQTSSAKNVIPDILLTRPDDSVESEKALNAKTLDPSKLLFLTTKTPVIACYGRLAEEEVSQRNQAKLLAEFVKLNDLGQWSRGQRETLRSMMGASPFRNVVRDAATKGLPISVQVVRSTAVLAEVDGKIRSIASDEEPIGSPIDLPGGELRLSSLPDFDPRLPQHEWKPKNSVACLASQEVPVTERVNWMQAGLKALAAREAEDASIRDAILPSPTQRQFSERELSHAQAAFTDAYARLGFGSRKEAENALRKLSFWKSSNIGFSFSVTNAEGERNTYFWGIAKV